MKIVHAKKAFYFLVLMLGFTAQAMDTPESLELQAFPSSLQVFETFLGKELLAAKRARVFQKDLDAVKSERYSLKDVAHLHYGSLIRLDEEISKLSVHELLNAFEAREKPSRCAGSNICVVS